MPDRAWYGTRNARTSRAHGAQAILTLRGWDQSNRFDEAWALVAITLVRNGIPMVSVQTHSRCPIVFPCVEDGSFVPQGVV